LRPLTQTDFSGTEYWYRPERLAAVLWTLVRVIAAISLTIWCVLHLRVFDHYFAFELPNVVRIPGLVLLATGGGLVLWCGGILSGVGILEERGDRFFPAEFVSKRAVSICEKSDVTWWDDFVCWTWFLYAVDLNLTVLAFPVSFISHCCGVFRGARTKRSGLEKLY
jgi:hypothetical protein